MTESIHPGQPTSSASITPKVTPGRIVNFVMHDKTIRPMMVVRVWNDEGLLNGHIFLDGSNDINAATLEFFQNNAIDSQGHIYSARYADPDQTGLESRTWHWPARS